MIFFSSWLMKFPRCLSSLHMILSLTRRVLMDIYSFGFFEVFLFSIHILLWRFIRLRPFRRGRKSYSVIQKLCRYSLKVLRFYALDWLGALDIGIYRRNSWWGLQILGFSQKSLACTCICRYSCKRCYTKLQFEVQWKHAWATQRLIFIAVKFPWVCRAGDFNW